MLHTEDERVRIYALGGAGEIGKNMYVVEVGTEVFVLDAGVMIPEGEMLGIDFVIPDITHLMTYKDNLKGIFLTNSHDDHIGSLPFILQKLSIPVYGTKLALGVLQNKLKEVGFAEKVQLIEIDANTVLPFHEATVSFYQSTHTIFDAVGICIETKQGSIVYTGDFKIDQTPVDQKLMDFSRLADISNKGVLCLLTSCINAEKPGYSLSESKGTELLNDAIQWAEDRVVVTASMANLYRIQQVFDAAFQAERKVIILGKGNTSIIDTAIKKSYLHLYKQLIISPNQIAQLPDNKIVILVTGNENKVISELQKLTNRTHKITSIKATDTVIITEKASARNEKSFAKIVDQLFRSKAQVHYRTKSINILGNACQEELKLMMNLLKPKYVIPVHGEFKMQKALQKIALETGLLEDNVFLAENGDVIEFKGSRATPGGKIHTSNVLIDGLGIGDIGNIVLRDRKLLSEDGILTVVVTLSKDKRNIIAGPEIISRGFVYVRESEELFDKSTEMVSDLLTKCMTENVYDWSTLKLNIRDSLSRFLFEKTKRKPMILPIIMEV